MGRERKPEREEEWFDVRRPNETGRAIQEKAVVTSQVLGQKRCKKQVLTEWPRYAYKIMGRSITWRCMYGRNLLL
jgi:hypothetical protein